MIRKRVHEATRSLRATGRTIAFFLKVLPMLPSRPVNWVTQPPRIDRVRYPTPDGEAEGELYRPPGAGPHPGIVVCLGVVPFEVDHPQVPRLGEALARTGFAALLYWSPAMRDLRLDPTDVEGLALAYRWLIEQPVVDPHRSGLLGTCVGGSFALLGAAHPAIRERVAFVAAWAPYGSMRTLARDIASGTTLVDGTIARWEVDQLTRKVFARSMTGILSPGEAERVRAAAAEPEPRIDTGDLSPLGQQVAGLIAGTDRDQAERLVAALPLDVLARLDAISPALQVDAIRAPLIVHAHDRGDRVIPIAESRLLQEAFDQRPGVRYTEFRMFQHLDPTKVKLAPVAKTRELAKFVGSVYPVFRQSQHP